MRIKLVFESPSYFDHRIHRILHRHDDEISMMIYDKSRRASLVQCGCGSSWTCPFPRLSKWLAIFPNTKT